MMSKEEGKHIDVIFSKVLHFVKSCNNCNQIYREIC